MLLVYYVAINFLSLLIRENYRLLVLIVFYSVYVEYADQNRRGIRNIGIIHIKNI